MMINKFKITGKQKAFTLVEMLIAVSLFIVIVTMSIGSLLSIFDANKRAQSSKTVVDNLNLSIENMARSVRFGKTYHCDNGIGTLTSPADCAGGTRFAVNFKGSTIVYRWNGGSGNPIERSDDGGGSYKAITSPDTVIEYVSFYVFGSTVGDTSQPYVIVVIRGYVGSKPTSQSRFAIETIMSQRELDL